MTCDRLILFCLQMNIKSFNSQAQSQFLCLLLISWRSQSSCKSLCLNFNCSQGKRVAGIQASGHAKYS